MEKINIAEILRNWSKFQRPFKDGDIVITSHNEHAFIYSGENNDYWECYCGVYCGSRNICINSKQWSSKIHKLRLATEEEKQKLFDIIKEHGYKWNAETKTLEKLIEPKFKVGDRVRCVFNNFQYIITNLTDTHYTLVEVIYKFKYTEHISEQKKWELVPNKFDITTLKPFDKVLVKDYITKKWIPDLFGCLRSDDDYPYEVIGGVYWKCCIPYEGNEHLLGTTDDCDEYYKTWEE